jgi:site-specific recombinase XerD
MTYDIKVILEKIHRYLTASPLSPSTKEMYTYFLHMFFQWFRKERPNAEPEEVDGVMVSEWFASNPGWSSSTKHNGAAALRGFYAYMYGKDHPVTQVRVRKIEAGPQRTLDRSELSAMLSKIDTATEMGIRDLAIITLMVDTGMRSGEVCGLELKHLDMRKNRLTVLTKGGVWGEKLFFEYTSSCLESWLAIRSMIADKTAKTVFVAIGGKRSGQPLTRSGIRYVCEKAANLADIEHVSPHAMRRTFATLATEEGAPTRMVQVAGGWKSIRMVEHYTQSVKPDNMKKYSPINKIMGLNEEEGPNK